MQCNSLSYQELPDSLAEPWRAGVLSLHEALELHDLWLEAGCPERMELPRQLQPLGEKLRQWRLLKEWEPPQLAH